MNCKDSIKAYCGSLGLDAVGFSKCRIYSELEEYLKKRQDDCRQNEFENKDIYKRINPFLNMKEGKTIVSIAFPYFHEIKQKSGNKAYFSKYTLGLDYHLAVPAYLKKICAYIERLGGKAAYFVDSNALPEVYIAYRSGIGFIGKNNMLITKKYGSYVFLGEIITDLEIEEDTPIKNGCGNCGKCIKACPSGSLQEKNPNFCLSYITQKKEINDKFIKQLNGRLFGCDTCQDVCPHNYKIEKSPLDCFEPYEYMANPDIEKIIFMNNREFKEKYKKTASGWRGKRILQRNALISLMALDLPEKGSLSEGKFDSQEIKDIYNRLLNIFNL